MLENQIIPMIIWCENIEELIEIEKYTELYFTETAFDNIGEVDYFTNGDIIFPCVYHKTQDTVHNSKGDLEGWRYDIYEYLDTNYKNIEEFKQKKFYDLEKEENLRITTLEEIPEIYPEYIIWVKFQQVR